MPQSLVTLSKACPIFVNALHCVSLIRLPGVNDDLFGFEPGTPSILALRQSSPKRRPASCWASVIILANSSASSEQPSSTRTRLRYFEAGSILVRWCRASSRVPGSVTF